MNKEKRPILDEGIKKVILSRLFGKNGYATNSDTSDMWYIGYCVNIPLQVNFWQNMVDIDVLKKVSKKQSVVVNKMIAEKVFCNEDVKGETDEEVDFSNTLLASVAASKEGIALSFNYKSNKENAA